MEKKIITEIKRIHEIMGVKTPLNEQLRTFIKSLTKNISDEFISLAKTVLGKTVNSIDDLTEVEIKSIIKVEGNAAIKSLRRNLWAEMTNKLIMTPAKFEQKTFKELMNELGNIGVNDPEIAARYIKNYAAANGIDTADAAIKKSVGGGSTSSITSNTPPPGKGGKQVNTPSGAGAQRSFNRFKQKYPQQAESFEDKLEVLSPSQSTRDKLLTSVDDLWDMSISELQSTIKKLEDDMTEAQLTTFTKLRKNLGKIWPGWKPVLVGTGGTITLILIIMLGRKILTCVKDISKCLFGSLSGVENALTDEENSNTNVQPTQGTQPSQPASSTGGRTLGPDDY